MLNKGYHFITQKFHTRFGEIDLIFTHKNTLVFIEVKTRSNVKWGFPEDAINKRKLSNIQKAAYIFLSQNTQWQNSPLRIDVVAIQIKKEKVVSMRHHECVY